MKKDDFLLETRGVHVWTFQLSAPRNVVDLLRSQLAEDDLVRANAFRFPHLQAQYVVAHAVLRYLLAAYLGTDPAELHFSYNEQGKPRVADPDCNLQFNLSHSNALASCAFALNCEIGVDIEQIRVMPDLFDIAQRFFSPDECKDLESAAESKREAAFFDCWTRKEAYIKAIGGGLSVPLESFRVSLLEGEPTRLLRARPGDPRPWTIQEFDPAPGYRGALAYNEDPRHLVIRRTTPEECLRRNDIQGAQELRARLRKE